MKSIFKYNLSYKAIGLYYYLAHLKSLKNFKEPILIDRYKAVNGKRPRGTGRTSVRSGLKELIDSGWLHKDGRDKHGQVHWHLSYSFTPYDYYRWSEKSKDNYGKMIRIIRYPKYHMADYFNHTIVDTVGHWTDNGVRPKTLRYAIYTFAYHSLCVGIIPKYRFKYVYRIVSDGLVWRNFCHWHNRLIWKVNHEMCPKEFLKWPNVRLSTLEDWGIKFE